MMLAVCVVGRRSDSSWCLQRELGWLVDDSVEHYIIGGKSRDATWQAMQQQLAAQPQDTEKRLVRMRTPLDRLEFAWQQRVVVRSRCIAHSHIITDSRTPGFQRMLDKRTTVAPAAAHVRDHSASHVTVGQSSNDSPGPSTCRSECRFSTLLAFNTGTT